MTINRVSCALFLGAVLSSGCSTVRPPVPDEAKEHEIPKDRLQDADIARIGGQWWARTDVGYMHTVVPGFDSTSQFWVPAGSKCVSTYWNPYGDILAQEVSVSDQRGSKLVEVRTGPPWFRTTPEWWSQAEKDHAKRLAREAGIPEFAIGE